MAEQGWRAQALANAVALVAAEVHGVDVDPVALTEGVTPAEQQSALTWLAARLTQYAFGSSGPFVLEIVGSLSRSNPVIDGQPREKGLVLVTANRKICSG